MRKSLHKRSPNRRRTKAGARPGEPVKSAGKVATAAPLPTTGVAPTRKPKLSGAARRKLQREALREKERILAAEGALMPTRRVYGPINTGGDIGREMRLLLTDVLAGRVSPEEAAKISYTANIVAAITRLEEELALARELQAGLDRLQGRQQPALSHWSPEPVPSESDALVADPRVHGGVQQ